MCVKKSSPDAPKNISLVNKVNSKGESQPGTGLSNGRVRRSSSECRTSIFSISATNRKCMMTELSTNEISCLLVKQPLLQNGTVTPIKNVKYVYVLTGLSFLANMVLIYGFFKTSRPFSIVTKLFIYLSVSDAMTGVGFSLTTGIMTYMIKEKYCITLLVLWGFNQFQFLFGTSVFLTISVLRFIALRWPLKRIRTRYVYYFMIVQFSVEIILTYIPIAVILKQKSLSSKMFKMSRYISSVLIMFIALTFIINIMSYVQLQQVKKEDRNPDIELGHTTNVQEQTQFKQKREAVKTLLLITLCYLICYLPYTIFMFAYQLNGSRRRIRYVLFFINLANGGLNSLVYIFRTKKIRQVYWLMVCGGLPSSSE